MAGRRIARRRALAGAALIALLAALALLLTRHGASPPAPTVPPGAPPPRSAPPPLPLRQAIGQRMVFAYAGPRPPAALERRIRRGEAAGVILFARNVASRGRLRATLSHLQAIRRPAGLDAPLLVLVDQEGGPVRRLPGAPRRGAAATGTAAAARAAGRAAGRNLRSVGANVDLAPVVDVGRPGSALEREGRTYGRDARRVSSLAAAFARGLWSERVAATYKHFPGLGRATVNTDDAPARIAAAASALRAVDLRPYRHPPAGVRLVMLATAAYPTRDPRPAAFSRRWATGELRHRLGFRGVTITDDLQTPAVSRYGSPGQLAWFAARAGVDIPLFARDYAGGARAAAGLLRAARAGRLERTELQASARRVLALRRALAGTRASAR